MTPEQLLEWLKLRELAVQASVFPDGRPQAAVVGFVVTDRFEFVFDTEVASRKMGNLRRDPKAALVIGWDEEQTVQVEGVADEPKETDLDRIKQVYFARFPEGQTRARQGGVTWVRVVPAWIRYSDFRGSQPAIVEYGKDEITKAIG